MVAAVADLAVEMGHQDTRWISAANSATDDKFQNSPLLAIVAVASMLEQVNCLWQLFQQQLANHERLSRSPRARKPIQPRVAATKVVDPDSTT